MAQWQHGDPCRIVHDYCTTVKHAWWRQLGEHAMASGKGLGVSMIDEVMERLRQSQAIRDMKAADDEALKWFDVAMRHYARMAREELDRRGVRPMTLIGSVEVFDRRDK
jgi:hypothetical protein